MLNELIIQELKQGALKDVSFLGSKNLCVIMPSAFFMTSAKLSGKNGIKTVSIVFGVTLLMSLAHRILLIINQFLMFQKITEALVYFAID